MSYNVTLSVPLHRYVAIQSPKGERPLSLQEDPVPGDNCTTSPNALPTFNAYSASGDVTSTVLYVNYGRREDYEELRARGYNTTGRIALVRYGHLFRGLKVMIAQDYGIAAVLIYSDPADDGAARGAVYPQGPWRPDSSVQRGSTQFLSILAGDPVTPWYVPRGTKDHRT